ncbi:MAG TPA: hypothetical protein VD788_04555 [Candidatus Polarisedimenticolaceae bacterium]|nr:hypothetical protein [Candidatus Polarisedimenticolaceae bacterium]
MNAHCRFVLALVLASLAAACSGSRSTGSAAGGTASLSVDGTTYHVHDVSMTIELGEQAWFRIDGEPVGDPHADCVPGLGAGLGLYGDLPDSVRQPIDLGGKRLRVDFTGDGDDANFCFVGMGGLAGAEDAWVTIESVNGDRVAFSMSGTFRVYDENGDGPVRTAQASGTALLAGAS